MSTRTAIKNTETIGSGAVGQRNRRKGGLRPLEYRESEARRRHRVWAVAEVGAPHEEAPSRVLSVDVDGAYVVVWVTRELLVAAHIDDCSFPLRRWALSDAGQAGTGPDSDAGATSRKRWAPITRSYSPLRSWSCSS